MCLVTKPCVDLRNEVNILGLLTKSKLFLKQLRLFIWLSDISACKYFNLYLFHYVPSCFSRDQLCSLYIREVKRVHIFSNETTSTEDNVAMLLSFLWWYRNEKQNCGNSHLKKYYTNNFIEIRTMVWKPNVYKRRRRRSNNNIRPYVR